MTTTEELPRRGAIIGIVSTALAGCLGDDEEADASADDDSGPRGPVIGGVELSRSFPIVLFEAESGDLAHDLHWHDDEDLSHWHRPPLELDVGERRDFDIEIQDIDGEELTVGEEIEVSPLPEETEYFTASVSGSRFEVVGEALGEDEVAFELRVDEDAWTTPTLPVEVTD